MASTPAPRLYDELADFIMGNISPQEILALKVSPSAQKRADSLLERLKDDALTSDEAAELEQVAQFEMFVRVLNAQAMAAAIR